MSKTMVNGPWEEPFCIRFTVPRGSYQYLMVRNCYGGEDESGPYVTAVTETLHEPPVDGFGNHPESVFYTIYGVDQRGEHHAIGDFKTLEAALEVVRGVGVVREDLPEDEYLERLGKELIEATRAEQVKYVNHPLVYTSRGMKSPKGFARMVTEIVDENWRRREV